MHANGVNALDLEAGALELVDNPAKRGGRVGAGEDVLVHEQTPDQILVLPRLAQTGDLQEEDTVIIQHVVHLHQELLEVPHTDVLSHLQASDLLVAAGNPGRITVVQAQNAALRLVNASLAQSVVAPFGLVAAQGDTRRVRTVVHRGVLDQRAPTAAQV